MQLGEVALYDHGVPLGFAKPDGPEKSGEAVAPLVAIETFTVQSHVKTFLSGFFTKDSVATK